MRIWEPCPGCGKCPWRPAHAVAAHGLDPDADLDALVRWAAPIAS